MQERAAELREWGQSLRAIKGVPRVVLHFPTNSALEVGQP